MSRMSVRSSACTSAGLSNLISVTFDCGNFYKNMSKKPNLFKIGLQYWVIYIKTYFAGDIKSPRRRSPWVKRYHVVRLAEEEYILRKRATLLCIYFARLVLFVILALPRALPTLLHSLYHSACHSKNVQITTSRTSNFARSLACLKRASPS